MMFSFVDAASLAQLARDEFGRRKWVRAFSCRSASSLSCTRVIWCGTRRFAESCFRTLRFPADPFIDALRERWMAPALVAMRSERELTDVSASLEATLAERDTTLRADIAAHGLKHCDLLSCDKQEATVQQYKFCSACHSVWYCSAEHGALHWKEHKPTCRATVAAKEAAAGGV